MPLSANLGTREDRALTMSSVKSGTKGCFSAPEAKVRTLWDGRSLYRSEEGIVTFHSGSPSPQSVTPEALTFEGTSN
jgi:hypothetical protein